MGWHGVKVLLPGIACFSEGSLPAFSHDPLQGSQEHPYASAECLMDKRGSWHYLPRGSWLEADLTHLPSADGDSQIVSRETQPALLTLVTQTQ